MPEKRPREDADISPAKKQKKGFQVGPANLPDGSWRRKNEKIKAGLIEKAKIRKDYAKLKQREQPEPSNVRYEDEETAEAPAQEETPKPEPATMDVHPDRQQLVDGKDTAQFGESGALNARFRRPKAIPFQREARQAERQRKEAEERAKQREEAKKERERKLQEREGFRRAMAKARTGGKNGQRKLGRESKVLLAKVKRMVGEA